MKKYLPYAIIAMSVLGLGSLTSCHDEDFGASTAVLQERAFEQSFINEFGQPSADQSWDFYAQKMQSLSEGTGMTRATMTIGTPEEVDQPIGKAYFDTICANIKYSLEDGHNNSSVGQNAYSLTSTGDFKIYAILYEGWYEQEEGHYLDFGIAYMNGNREVRQQLFGWADPNDYGVNKGAALNPGVGLDSIPISGYAYNIPSAPGDQFYFYLTLYAPNKNNQKRYYRYYSNSSTYKYSQYLTTLNNGNPSTGTLKDRYNNEPAGPSVLLYSMEINDEAEGNKQIMILGFEDAWSDENADADYNDIVIILEGNLPEPTSKRFFCEDKESFDWDYNDVVFDVSNYGITLRAVGGTLPVFLRVKEKEQNSSRLIGMTSKEDKKTYYELHELMRSQQYQSDYINDKGELIEALHKNAQLTYTVGGKTYYRPIDVGTDPQGLWLDPVLIADWVGTTKRLTDDEVTRFANPLATNKVGDVELIVLPQSQYSSTGYNVETLLNLPAFPGPGDDPDAPKIIQMTEVGKVPAIWSSPVSVQWMKELQKITLGYKDFYGAGDADNVYGHQWWENNLDRSYMYDYTGDGDDTYTP